MSNKSPEEQSVSSAADRVDDLDDVASDDEVELNDEDTTVEHEAEEIVEEAEGYAQQISDLTEMVKRQQADFTNYRRRIEKEKQEQSLFGQVSVIKELLPILDDLDRAKAHGDLTSGLKAVSDKLFATLIGMGLAEFGVVGEPFDPEKHEAIQNEGSGHELEISTLLRKGYIFKGKILRTAMVIVTDAGTVAAEDSDLLKEEVAQAEVEDPIE